MVTIGKKSKFLIIFWVFFYIFVFGLLIKNSFSSLDPDFGWHLRVGEEVASTRMVPHANNYNYTYTGNWVDHEWLSNLIVYEIYNNYGYLALNIFFALIILFSLLVLNYFARRFSDKISDSLLAVLQIFALTACLPHFGIRIQEFGFLFMALELWIIMEFDRKVSWRVLLCLLPLFYLWSNMHGSFLLGLGLLIAYPLAKLFQRYLSFGKLEKYFQGFKIIQWSEVSTFYIFTLGSVLVTLITPYGFELYSFLSGYKNTYYLGAIKEWLPQFHFPYDYLQLLYLALVLVVLGQLIYVCIRYKSRAINIWQLGLTLILIFLSFKSRRHFPLLVVASFIFLIQSLQEFLDLENIKAQTVKKKYKYFIILCLVLTVTNQYLNIDIKKDPFSNYCNEYPCLAAEFLQKDVKLQNINIFNEYNWGGYLIWAYPTKKLFIDGRLPQTEYAGHTFLEEYVEFLKPKADFASKLEKYKIGIVLIKTKEEKIKARNWEKFLFLIKDKELNQPNYLKRYLDSAQNWEKIYSDPLATIYLKIY
ncbi:MAG: hypothetical protein WCN88_02865 [Candidatus Falkowbacteria bacterium]